MTADASQERLGTTFEQVPDLYDRARPTYPEELFDDLAALAELPAQPRVAEIGCGTGQATVPLAERGYAVTAVEMGERLAAIARRKLARFPNAEVVTTRFETWSPERADFDAVTAFTAFHWIDPDVRYTKTAELLRPDGKLAVVSTHHVRPPDGDPFFVEVQDDYTAVMPDDPATKADAGGPPRPDAVADLGEEIASSGRFRNVATRRYLWDVTYTADDYIDVLSTYSGHRALDDATRERLLSRIHRRIDARPERKVRKTYLAILDIAARI